MANLVRLVSLVFMCCSLTTRAFEIIPDPKNEEEGVLLTPNFAAAVDVDDLVHWSNLTPALRGVAELFWDGDHPESEGCLSLSEFKARAKADLNRKEFHLFFALESRRAGSSSTKFKSDGQKKMSSSILMRLPLLELNKILNARGGSSYEVDYEQH